MSVQTELTRITNAKAAVKAAIEGKGVTVPDGTLLDGMAPLIESIEAGGGGVQSDWNQNDSTQPDYVKNRPFYTGDPAETVLVEESTVSFAGQGGLYMGELASTFKATVGENYKVSWDGTAYECTCVKFQNNPAIGNLSIAGAGSDTGEPFLMAVVNGQGIAIATADTSASHTFSISGIVPEVVKIDEKYLPEYSVLYSGDPADWSKAKKQQMYDDFISGKILFYRTSSDDGISIVLSVFYSRNVGLQFVFFENYHDLRSFYGNAFSNPIDLSEYGINSLIKDYIDTLRSWKLYQNSSSDFSVGDLLSMHVAFDSTTNKACILTSTKADIGSAQLKSTIVTNGDTDIILSSSTAGSTKKFKITVDDSGVPTITDESDSTNTWKPTNLPTVTSSDSGKFLRVSDTGEWVAETILSASGVSF